MKKKITQILVAAMVICTTAFAGNNGGDQVNNAIVTEFSQKFSDATNVHWSSTSNYIKANFQMNGQYMAAYFANTGQVLGVSRNIVSNQLPLKLNAELKKNLTESWISELFEYASDDESSYYATLENADQKITLKSCDNYWIVVKKVKKS